MSGVVVGKGFRFGYKAAGDTEALLSLGAKYRLNVSVVDLIERDMIHGSEKVSLCTLLQILFIPCHDGSNNITNSVQ